MKFSPEEKPIHEDGPKRNLDLRTKQSMRTGQKTSPEDEAIHEDGPKLNCEDEANPWGRSNSWGHKNKTSPEDDTIHEHEDGFKKTSSPEDEAVHEDGKNIDLRTKQFMRTDQNKNFTWGRRNSWGRIKIKIVRTNQIHEDEDGPEDEAIHEHEDGPKENFTWGRRNSWSKKKCEDEPNLWGWGRTWGRSNSWAWGRTKKNTSPEDDAIHEDGSK
jgi:hypothetical protein